MDATTTAERTSTWKDRIKNPFKKESAPPKELVKNREVNLENALSKLPESDASALRAIGGQLIEIMKADELTGTILLPDKTAGQEAQSDIDLAVYIDPVHQLQTFLSELQQANRGYITLKNVAENLGNKLGYHIIEEVLPAADSETDDHNILREKGSIKIRRRTETPIKLKNEFGGNTQATKDLEGAPFAVLTQFPNTNNK